MNGHGPPVALGGPAPVPAFPSMRFVYAVTDRLHPNWAYALLGLQMTLVVTTIVQAAF